MGADETVVGGTIGACSALGEDVHPGSGKSRRTLGRSLPRFLLRPRSQSLLWCDFPRRFPGELQCLQSRGGRCLAVYSMAGDVCEAALYDLQTGQLLGMQTLPDGQYEAALLPDGTAAVLDEKTGRTLHYDAGLGRCLRQEEGWGSQWLLEDTGYLWALDETGLVRRVHLCDGVRQEYQLPEGEEHALVGFGQDRLLIWSAGEEETTAWLDWRTGSCCRTGLG